VAISGKNKVRIGLIQTSVGNDPSANLKKTVKRIETASQQGARVICLQEIFNTKYFPADDRKEVAHLAEPIPGRAETRR